MGLIKTVSTIFFVLTMVASESFAKEIMLGNSRSGQAQMLQGYGGYVLSLPPDPYTAPLPSGPSVSLEKSHSESVPASVALEDSLKEKVIAGNKTTLICYFGTAQFLPETWKTDKQLIQLHAGPVALPEQSTSIYVINTPDTLSVVDVLKQPSPAYDAASEQGHENQLCFAAPALDWKQSSEWLASHGIDAGYKGRVVIRHHDEWIYKLDNENVVSFSPQDKLRAAAAVTMADSLYHEMSNVHFYIADSSPEVFLFSKEQLSTYASSQGADNQAKRLNMETLSNEGMGTYVEWIKDSTLAGALSFTTVVFTLAMLTSGSWSTGVEIGLITFVTSIVLPAFAYVFVEPTVIEATSRILLPYIVTLSLFSKAGIYASDITGYISRVVYENVNSDPASLTMIGGAAVSMVMAPYLYRGANAITFGAIGGLLRSMAAGGGAVITLKVLESYSTMQWPKQVLNAVNAFASGLKWVLLGSR